jgi:hypothetical protein
MVGVGAGRVRILEWGAVEVDRVQRLHLLVWSSAKPKAASGRVGGRGVQTSERDEPWSSIEWTIAVVTHCGDGKRKQ